MFIELTITSGGKSVLVNTDNVAYIEHYDETLTLIHFIGDSNMIVDKPFDEVKALLKDTYPDDKLVYWRVK